ncbi:MAG: hypothetical protein V4721_18035 [Bacteroidota bacterium]
MIKPVAIAKDTGQYAALNFEFLRSTGIALIQQLAGKTWTDFNLHDPGVTILEQLCFAITELAYRTDFPIEDLLTNEKGLIDYDKNAFFPREEILTTNPVTVNDYRKVIIDELEQVQNVWLYPIKSKYSDSAISGLYRIYVQVTQEIAQRILSGDEAVSNEVSALVKKCFVGRRNLCEDTIHEIIILKPVRITVEADVMIGEEHIPEEVLANVYHYLESTMNMPVRYFSESELLNQGYTVDEIYSGPFLKKGFIPDSELGDRKLVVDPTELIKALSHISGVLSVKKLRIVDGQQSKHNKPFSLPENTFPLLDIQSSEQHVKIYRDNFQLPIKRPVFRLILQKIREAHNRTYISTLANKSSKNVLKGQHRNYKYYSIQNQFPKIYGIGPEGLLKSTSKQRKAQAKQLKGYLLFFEQILANYLSQLQNISEVFSLDLSKKNDQTYFKNTLYDVPDVKFLFKEFTRKDKEISEAGWESFKKSKSNGYIQNLTKANESNHTFIERKNKLFEHLLARFNEFVTIYPVQLHSALYDSHLADERVNAELRWKSKILKNLPQLGSGRVKASNYLDPGPNIGGLDFEDKMRMLLNIEDADHFTQKMLSSALSQHTISIEPKGRKFQNEENDSSDDSEDEASWQSEMPKILINKDEITDLYDDGRVISSDEVPNDAFLLKNQDVTVFKYALDIKNYRIGPNPAKESGYVLLYKAPQEKKWVTISRFPSHGAAMKAVKSLIDYVRTINVQSEGFYVIEHILLRPYLNSNNYGFRFIAKNGQKLMQHSKWTTFEDRELAIESLLDVLKDEREITPEKLAPFCKINLYAHTSDVPDPNGQKPLSESKNIYNYFKLYAAQQDKFLSRFEMVIRGEDNSMIPDDFFSMRMSVIFPTWPARFQDKNFREATENLFRLNTPAHVKINFIWMNLTNLKKFESLYFDWRKFIAEDTDQETRNELRNALVQMLIKYQ